MLMVNKSIKIQRNKTPSYYRVNLFLLTYLISTSALRLIPVHVAPRPVPHLAHLILVVKVEQQRTLLHFSDSIQAEEVELALGWMGNDRRLAVRRPRTHQADGRRVQLKVINHNRK